MSRAIMRQSLVVCIVSWGVLWSAGMGQVQGAGRLQPGTPEWFVSTKGLESTEYSEVEAELYRFDVKPVTPDSGINAGYVIAYGHPLSRPYRFSIVHDTILFVNGVQIRPYLGQPYLSGAYAAYRAALSGSSIWSKEEYARKHALDSACLAIYRRMVEPGHYTGPGVSDSIRAFLEANTDVAAIVVEDTLGEFVFGYNLLVSRPGVPPLHSMVDIAPPEKPDQRMYVDTTAAAIRRSRRYGLETQVGVDSTVLTRGGLVMYSPLSGGNYPPGTWDLIASTMNSDTLQWEQKAAILRKPFVLAQQVKEVMYNYVETEYASVAGGER